MSDTIISRLLLAHPDLGTTGGAPLHAEIAAIYTKIGDMMDSRYFTATIANSAFSDFEHNFGTDIANLRYDLYTVSGGVLTLVPPPQTGYTIAATPSFANTKLRVTNSTGSSKDIAIVLINDPFYLDECTDVNLSTPPADGEALVYDLATTMWKPGASGDASFKIGSVTTPNAVLKGGFILFNDDGVEKELATYNGSLYGADITINLTTILGASPANATTYYLYIDKTTLGAEQTESGTGRKLFQVAQANFVLDLRAPSAVDTTRYIEVGLFLSATTGTAWSGSGSAFRTVASKRHLRPVIDQTRNYMAPFFRPGNSVDTVVSGNVTDAGNRSLTSLQQWQTTNSANISISSSTTTPLRETASYLTTGSGNAGAGTTFIESPAFQLDTMDLGKAVLIGLDLNGNTADGNFDICMVRYNSSGVFQEKIVVAGNASTGTPATAKLPTGTTNFKGFFISSSTQSDYYAFRIRRLAGTDNLRLDSLFVGPQTLAATMALTDWVAFTPTGSFTTAVAYTGWYKQVGDSYKYIVQILFSGATDNVAASINLPSGHVIDTTKLPSEFPNNNVPGLGFGSFSDNSAGTTYPTVVRYNTTTVVGVRYTDDAATGVTTLAFSNTAPVTIASADSITVAFEVPIVGKSSNITMADRAVEEFAFNSSTATNANDSTSFAYGPAGALIQNITVALFRRVRFTTPIQPTDTLIFEWSTDRIRWFNFAGGWQLDSVSAVFNIHGYMQANGKEYGAGRMAIVNATDVQVYFGTYATIDGSSLTYGANGIAWSSGAGGSYWRVRKVSGGAVVGFPLGEANLYRGAAPGTVATPNGVAHAVTDTDGLSKVFMTTGASDRVETIPLAANNIGRKLILKKMDSGAGKMVPTCQGSDTIDGLTTFPLSFQYQSVEIEAVAANLWAVTAYPNKYSQVTINSSANSTASNVGIIAVTVPYAGVYYIRGMMSLLAGASSGDGSNMQLFIRTGSATYASATNRGQGGGIITNGFSNASTRGRVHGYDEDIVTLAAGDTVHVGRDMVNNAGTGQSVAANLFVQELKRI